MWEDTSWLFSKMTMSRFIRLKLWKNGWEEAWRIIFTHEMAPLSPDLKFIEILWDVLEVDFTECLTLILFYFILFYFILFYFILSGQCISFKKEALCIIKYILWIRMLKKKSTNCSFCAWETYFNKIFV